MAVSPGRIAFTRPRSETSAIDSSLVRNSQNLATSADDPSAKTALIFKSVALPGRETKLPRLDFEPAHRAAAGLMLATVGDPGPQYLVLPRVESDSPTTAVRHLTGRLEQEQRVLGIVS